MDAPLIFQQVLAMSPDRATQPHHHEFVRDRCIICGEQRKQTEVPDREG